VGGLVGKKGGRSIHKNLIKVGVSALFSRKSTVISLVILFFLACGLLSQVSTLAETGPFVGIDSTGRQTLEIPSLSEKNFIVTSSYNGTSTSLRQPSNIVVGLPVPWRLEVRKAGETRIVKYETPAVIKETSDYMNIDGKSWMKKISLRTSFKGVYENVSFIEPIVSPPINSIEPSADYILVSENIVKVTVPRLDGSIEMTLLGGGEPGLPSISVAPANTSEMAANASNASSLYSDAGNLTETIKQYDAEIGKPVRWLKIIRVRNRENISQPLDIVVDLPSSSENIVVTNSKLGSPIPKDRVHFTKIEVTLAQYDGGGPAGQDKKGLSNQNPASGPGSLASPEQTPKDVSFNDTLLPNSTNEYSVEYYTEAPLVLEESTADTKRVTVYSTTDYTDILTYTDIRESPADSIGIYWYASGADYARYILKDDSLAAGQEDVIHKVDITSIPEFAVRLIDSNNNGLIDRVEWITPHLSNQTFEISIAVLNPYTFIRDSESWIVAFETNGKANLTISSPNAGWTEFLTDNAGTFSEMGFLELRCGDISLKPNLKLVGLDKAVYDYASLTSADSIPIEKLLIVDYECNETGYITNLMHRAGYAALRFDFGGNVAYAYDAATISLSTITSNSTGFYTSSSLLGWCNASSTNDVTYIWEWYRNGAVYSGGDENYTTAYYYQETYNQTRNTGTFQAIAPAVNLTDGNWATYARANGPADAIVYENYSLYPFSANAGSRWQVTDGIGTANLTIPAGCWNEPIQVRARSYYGGGTGTRNATWECLNATGWQILRNGTSTAASRLYEDAMWWNATVKRSYCVRSPKPGKHHFWHCNRPELDLRVHRV
jgi:hypothetical protein